MNTLLERIDWLLLHRWKGNASAWSRAAGLARQHVNTIRSRLLADPRADVSTDTLRRLSDASGVTLEWIVSGVGAPDLPARSQPDTDLYPNRAIVVAAARAQGVEEHALEVLELDRNAEGDRTVEQWTTRLLEIRKGIRYVTRALQAEVDDSTLDHVPGLSQPRKGR